MIRDLGRLGVPSSEGEQWLPSDVNKEREHRTGAAGTIHSSPIPSISAILVAGATALLALYLPARHAAATAGVATSIAVLTAILGFEASAIEAIWSSGFAAVSTAFAIAIVRRLRPGTQEHKAEQSRLDARSPAEPILLELARQTFAEFDRCDVERTQHRGRVAHGRAPALGRCDP
jgi:hypothetical protein